MKFTVKFPGWKGKFTVVSLLVWSGLVGEEVHSEDVLEWEVSGDRALLVDGRQ